MTHVERYELWKIRISDYQSSGLSVSKWCEHHQLNVHTMKYWLQKFRTNNQMVTEPATQWFSINVNATNESASLLLFVRDVRVEVFPGFDPSLLCDVVRVLKTC
jgi:hypothetical protein